MVKMGEPMKPMAFVEEDDAELSGSVSYSGDSRSSIGSLSSDLTDDDVTSSPTSSPPPTSPSQLDACGPLYELPSLMAHLPIKRGLSNFFSGKSQSFTSLSNVRCVEDLAKKETPYRRKIMPNKSYGGMFDLSTKSYFTPGPFTKTITKKSSRASCAPLAAKRGNTDIFGSSNPPSIPAVEKNL